MKDFTTSISNYKVRLLDTINNVSTEEWNMLTNVLSDACAQGKQIFIMGNGGSAATASHFTGDFNKGCSYGKDKRFKFICLNDNFPTMLAYANDISYDMVFVEPLKNFFNSGDVVIGISGSGNSKNVLNAIEWANQNGGISVGLTGYDGGVLKTICEYNVHAPINDMQITEDLHIILCHSISQILGATCL